MAIGDEHYFQVEDTIRREKLNNSTVAKILVKIAKKNSWGKNELEVMILKTVAEQVLWLH